LMKICLSPPARVRFASATTVSTEKRVASGMRHLQQNRQRISGRIRQLSGNIWQHSWNS
jgi:hypothetical protein